MSDVKCCVFPVHAPGCVCRLEQQKQQGEVRAFLSLCVCVSLCMCVVHMQQGEDECCVALWWGHQTVANSTTSLFVITVFFSSPPSPECRWDSWILNIWRKERIWASCAHVCVYVCAVRHVTVSVITYEYMCLHCSVNAQHKLQCVSVCLPVFWQVLVCLLEARFILTCKWGVTAEIYFFNLESILIKFALAEVHFLLNVAEFMVTWRSQTCWLVIVGWVCFLLHDSKDTKQVQDRLS